MAKSKGSKREQLPDNRPATLEEAIKALVTTPPLGEKSGKSK